MFLINIFSIGAWRSGSALAWGAKGRRFKSGRPDPHKMAIQLNQDNFENEIKTDKPLLVDFWAEWCAPCRAIAPILEEIEKEMNDKIKIAKLNVDENPDIASKHRVFSIPTLVIFKNGQEIGRMIGAAPKSKILKFIEDSLKNS